MDRATSDRRPPASTATVLWAEFAGLAATPGESDADATTGIVEAFAADVDSIVGRFGGRVERRTVDLLTAVWGSGVPSGDDPERAVRAGLKLCEAFTTLRSQIDEDVSIGVGLDTGRVLWNTSSSASVTGDAVDVARELARVAPEDGVLVSHDTYRHVRGVFDMRRRHAVDVDGVRRPAPTYEVSRAKAHGFRITWRGVEGVDTRFVGRDEQVEVLHQAFVEVVERGRARVVNVYGEAGTGTSRLLDEFSEWLEARPERIHLLRGSCSLDTKTSPRGLVRELLADRFEVYDDETSVEVAAKLRSGLSSLTSRQADVVGHWLGFDLAESTAVRDLTGSPDFGTTAFGHLAAHLRWLLADAPGVALLEDVHWSDPESLDTIGHLIDALHDAPLLIVSVARPSHREHELQPGPGLDVATTVDLEPLSEHGSRDLVEEILRLADHVPRELVEVIVDRADGNPFHIEELVKMFVDDGVIAMDRDTWRIDLEQLDARTVPTTLNGVIQARFAALHPEESAMLQHAAVIGREFWDDALVALSAARGSGPTTHADAISSLWTARVHEFVRPRHRSVFNGCREYEFRHELLRVAMYETLPPLDRSQLHRAVAAWLERHSGERLGEHVALLAKHLSLGGELDRAADLLHEAGARAVGTGALQSAVDFFERSLVARQELGSEHGLAATSTRIKLAHAFALLGRNDEATSMYGAAESDARFIGSGRLAANALAGALRTAAVRGDWDESARLVEQVRPLAERFGGEILGRFLSAEAILLLDGPERDVEAAHALNERVLEIWREVDDPVSELRAINDLALVSRRRGRSADADRWVADGLALARRIGDTTGEWMLLQNQAVFAHLAARAGQEDYVRVLDLYRSSLETRQLLGLPHILSLANLAQAEIEAGEVELGARHALDALGIAWTRHDPRDWTLSLITVAQSKIATGDVEEGLRILGAVLAERGTTAIRQEIDAVVEFHGIDPPTANAGMADGSVVDVGSIVDEVLAGDA